MPSNEIVTEVRFWNLNTNTTAVKKTIKAI
jgi:hypothetical protein